MVEMVFAVERKWRAEPRGSAEKLPESHLAQASTGKMDRGKGGVGTKQGLGTGLWKVRRSWRSRWQDTPGQQTLERESAMLIQSPNPILHKQMESDKDLP